MIQIVICLVIVIIIYCILLKITNTSCLGENELFEISVASGSRIKGIDLSKNLGFPTVNIKLDEEIPCGIYNGESNYGYVTFVVVKNGKKAYVNFAEYKEEIDEIDRFRFTNLNRIVNSESDLISTYNRGCCK